MNFNRQQCILFLYTVLTNSPIHPVTTTVSIKRPIAIGQRPSFVNNLTF